MQDIRELVGQDYQLLYVDPPWKYNDKAKNRIGAERHYPTMTPNQLRRLPVRGISAEDAVLYLWVTYPQLEVALMLMRAWGFTYTTGGFTWVKTNKKQTDTLFMGGGHHTRSNAEICLLGVKGKGLKRLSRSIRQTQMHPVEEHSKKPDAFRTDLETLYGGVKRVELFSRHNIDGWDGWGLEYPEE